MNAQAQEPPKDNWDKYATKDDLFDLKINIEKRFSQTELKFENRFNSVENKIDKLELKMNLVLWFIGCATTLIVSSLGASFFYTIKLLIQMNLK